MRTYPKTSVAVIGVGEMGRNHARVLREMPQVDLVAVADANLDASESVASYFGAHAYSDYKLMLQIERPQAVTIAVPTQFHYQIAVHALQAGCHILVEKPIAATVEEAREMISVAERARRVLMVGHIERYNPAIEELKRRLDAGEAGNIFHLHARRLGPFPARVRDVGVVVDLATHDLDVMRYLTGTQPTRLFSETRRNIHTSNEDMLDGLVVFESGAVGLLEINWLTPTKIRELYVTAERGMFLANYLTQDLQFFENAEVNGPSWSHLTALRGVSEGAMTRFAIRKKEPLRVEMEAFLSALHGCADGCVTGPEALAALEAALALVQSGIEHRPIELALV